MIHSLFRKNKIEQSKEPFAIQEGRIRGGELHDFSYRMEWTEDSFVDGVAGMDKVGGKFSFARLYVFGFFIVFFLFVLLGRTAWLQVVKGEHYYGIAEGNRVRVKRVEAKRGVIYDRNLVPLVYNKANFLLYLVPIDLPRDDDKRKNIFEQLVSMTQKITLEDLESLYDKENVGSLESYRPVFIDDHIPYDEAIKLDLESESMPGIVITVRTRREYNSYAPSMSHILGYTGKINQSELDRYGEEYLPIDYIGKMGVEYFWENELKGISGNERIEVNALGKEKRILSQTEAEDGHNLVLSINIVMQKKLEEILLKHLDKLNLERASVVVLNPNNGEVLSMVSLPAYDNNIFARGISVAEYGDLMNNEDKPLFNRAVSGEYPSGSTFKIIMSAAALEEGIIDENTSFLSTGGLRIHQWFFPDWRAGGHGMTNVRKAIAQSVNTFYYSIGGGYDDFSGLGVDKIVHYGKLFGLGSQTGIDMAGEADGFLPTREWKKEVKNEKWYIGDTYHLSIGQGDLLVTPLQVAVYTSVFANGGKLYRPHLVKYMTSDNNAETVEISNSLVREDFIKDYNIRIVREGMRQAVTQGSARSLNFLPVETAGKTGTAQWSSKKDPHAWFVGFAPYDNPELAFSILVEAGGEGSSVSVPIAKEFLEWYFGEYKKLNQE